MKPPVKLETLMEEWSKDSEMDTTEPSKELAKIPSLHSKYLRILTHHNIIAKKLSFDYNKLKKLKIEYYSGDLNNPEDLEEHNLEPWSKKVLRQDLPIYIDSDEQLQEVLMKKVLHEEIANYCTMILKEIHSRTFQLKSIIEWERFTNGSG